MSSNAEQISGLGILRRWLDGGEFVQIVVSGPDGEPTFATISRLTDVSPQRITATLPEVPFAGFEFILPPAVQINTGTIDLQAKATAKAEYAKRVREPWVVITIPGFDCVMALGRIPV